MRTENTSRKKQPIQDLKGKYTVRICILKVIVSEYRTNGNKRQTLVGLASL